jgi:hypothetical protein
VTKKIFLLIIRQNTPNESVLGYWLVLNINFFKKYIKSIVNVLSILHMIIMLGQESSNIGKYVRSMLFGSGIQVIWVLLVCQIQVNMGLAQFLKFKNNKTILKYQNVLYDYRKLHRKQTV